MRTRREEQKLSQEQVSALSENGPWRVSRSAISAIERGRNLPSLEGMIALSRVLHVDPLEIIERAEVGPDPDPLDPAELSFEELDRRAADRFVAGDFRGALSIYDSMRERVVAEFPADPAESRSVLARIEIRRASALRRCGALLAARAAVERGLDLSHDRPSVTCQAYVLLSTLHVQMDNTTLARDTAERAVALGLGCEGKIRGRARLNRGLVYVQDGEFEQARKTFVEARNDLRSAGDERHYPHVEGNLGLCWIRLGRPGQARARFVDAVKHARRLGMPAVEASWLVELGRACLAEDDLETAEGCVTAALRIAQPGEQWLTVFRAEWLRHRIVRRRDPNDPDRVRMSLLGRLLMRLEDHRTETAIQEFRREQSRRT